MTYDKMNSFEGRTIAYFWADVLENYNPPVHDLKMNIVWENGKVYYFFKHK
jgi:hypothetical protein